MSYFYSLDIWGGSRLLCKIKIDGLFIEKVVVISLVTCSSFRFVMVVLMLNDVVSVTKFGDFRFMLKLCLKCVGLVKCSML